MAKKKNLPKKRRSFKELWRYEDTVTGYRKDLVPIWLISVLAIALLVFYLSEFQEDFMLRQFGWALNYFLPIFYLFIMIAYFVNRITGNVQ